MISIYNRLLKAFANTPKLESLLKIWENDEAKFRSYIKDYEGATPLLRSWVDIVKTLYHCTFSSNVTRMEYAEMMNTLRIAKVELNVLQMDYPQHEGILCKVFSLITNIGGLEGEFTKAIKGWYHLLETCVRRDGKIVIPQV